MKKIVVLFVLLMVVGLSLSTVVKSTKEYQKEQWKEGKEGGILGKRN